MTWSTSRSFLLWFMFDNIQLFPCRKFDSSIFCCVLHIAGEIVLFVKNVSCRNTWGNIRRLLIIISNYRLSIIIGNFGSSRLDQKMNRNYTLGHSVTWKFELYLVLVLIEFLLNFANLNFNFNYNLVIAEISFTLQFSNHPPTRKSSDNCDISAVTDQILMKI